MDIDTKDARRLPAHDFVPVGLILVYPLVPQHRSFRCVEAYPLHGLIVGQYTEQSPAVASSACWPGRRSAR